MAANNEVGTIYPIPAIAAIGLGVEAPIVQFKDPDKTLPPLITLAANQGFLPDWRDSSQAG
ncbi:MAG: hypothetical protein VKL98_06535 [Cyanobacteriota bacterium]|nr:hypothetical protein [Cyanobacteriota bacterium]